MSKKAKVDDSLSEICTQRAANLGWILRPNIVWTIHPSFSQKLKELFQSLFVRLVKRAKLFAQHRNPEAKKISLCESDFIWAAQSLMQDKIC